VNLTRQEKAMQPKQRTEPSDVPAAMSKESEARVVRCLNARADGTIRGDEYLPGMSEEERAAVDRNAGKGPWCRPPKRHPWRRGYPGKR
jgi:hypothetical protein